MAKLLWTQKQDIGPGARSGHAMAFDAVRKRVVLFGGSAIGTLFGDTWEWDGTMWHERRVSGPGVRLHHFAAFDARRGRLVLYGGLKPIEKTVERLTDTWEWDGVVWKQVEDVGPSQRQGAGMVGSVEGLLLFGGTDGVDFFGDTWAWDGEHWRQRQDIGPSPRHTPAMAWDAARDRAVLFGGDSPNLGGSRVVGDTWEAFETP